MKSPKCLRGCGKGRKGAVYCATCGAKLPTVVKSATRQVFYNPAFVPGAATPVLRKAAGASQAYVHPTRRGALYDDDPAVRELAWLETYGPTIDEGL